MTENDARVLTKNYLLSQVNEQYPNVWIGDVWGEDERMFIVQGAIYADGDNPENFQCPYNVWKSTGEVFLPGGIPDPDDMWW